MATKEKTLTLLLLICLLFLSIAFWIVPGRRVEYLLMGASILAVFIAGLFLERRRKLVILIFSSLVCVGLFFSPTSLFYFHFTYLFTQIGSLLVVTLITYFLKERYSPPNKEEIFTEKKREIKEISEKNEKLRKRKSFFLRKIEETEALFELSKQINATLEFKKIMDIVEKAIENFLSLRSYAFFRLEEGRRFFKEEFAGGIEEERIKNFLKILNYSDFIPRYLKKSSKNCLVIKLEEFSGFKEPFLILPFRMKEEICGLIWSLDLEKKKELEKEDRQILLAQISIALEKALLYEKVEKMSISDGITGLYNHRHFQKLFEREIERCKRYQHQLCLLYMDLDNFKQYNDLYGHLVGDTILREVGKIIKMSVDKFDLVARYGGEEFVVVLVDASLEEGVKVAERIRGNIAAHKFFVGGKVSYITVSIGVSSLPEDGWEKEILLGKADQLTYRAKEKGKNCVVSTLTNR